MLFPEKDHNKLTHSINATAALSYLLQQQRDAVGVCTFSDDIIMRTPIKSNSLHINNIFHLLESIEYLQNLHRIYQSYTFDSFTIIRAK